MSRWTTLPDAVRPIVRWISTCCVESLEGVEEKVEGEVELVLFVTEAIPTALGRGPSSARSRSSSPPIS
jgi:hypothetical protein